MTKPNKLLSKIAKSFEDGGSIDSALKFAGSIVKEDEDSILGYTLNKTGKAFAIGVAAVGTANAAINERNVNDMGTNIGIRAATPSIRGYLPQKGMGDISAGASGDLVFAMHNQRGRGYL